MGAAASRGTKEVLTREALRMLLLLLLVTLMPKLLGDKDDSTAAAADDDDGDADDDADDAYDTYEYPCWTAGLTSRACQRCL